MPRALRILAWATGALIVVPVVAIALVFVVANMDWGRRLIESTTAQLSRGQVLLTGISGHFPDDLHVAHAEIRDDGTPWLTADDVTLQWWPSALAHQQLQIQLLRAAQVQLLRLPASRENSTSSRLPVRVDLTQVEIHRLDIGAPIAGAAASVSLEGHLHAAASLQEAEGALTAKRLDAPGDYVVSGRVDPAFLKIELDLNEPARGLLAGLAKLPDLGALSIQASAEGPRNAQAMRLAVAAGPLRATGQGKVDLVAEVMDLDLTANAPAMAPRQDVSWKLVSMQAHIHGPFKGPDATGQVRIDGLNAGAVQFRTFSADLEGNRGSVGMHAVLDRLRIPGRKPDLFQAVPIDLRVDAKLDDPLRPVTFSLSHPLVSVQGNAKTAGELSAALTIKGPALAPLAAVAGLDLKGHATLEATVAVRGPATKVELNGVVAVTGGTAPLPALIGDAAKLGASLSIQGADLSVERAQLDGRALRVSGNGTAKNGIVDLNWKVALSDVAVVASKVSGRIEAQGRIHGAPDNLDLVADATGEVGTEGFPRGPIRVSASLEGLPAAPAGRVEAHGSIDGSPLELTLAIQRARDGALLGTIEHADWKSAHAEGSVSLRARDRLPQGRMAVRVAQLEDLRPWIGQAVQGSVVADIDLVQSGDHAQAKLQLDARNVVIGGARVDHLSMTGRVDDPTTRPKAALQLAADGIATNGITGSARLQANGPQEALVLKLSSDLRNVGEADAQITTTATLNATARQVSFSAMQAHYKGQTAQLLAPASVSFGDGLAVDRLRIGVQQAVLEASGRVAPTLEVTTSVHNVTPELIKAFGPDLQAEGTLSADARLSGTTAQPRGTVHVNVTGLRTRSGAGRTLPASNLVATAELEDQSARIDVRLSGGSQMRFNASGRVPFSASGAIDLHANGTVDATIANPILEVNGRRVKGQITLDLAVTGTRAAPKIDGNAKLAQGDLQDYTLGAHLSDVEAQLQAAGDTVRIVSFTAHAGPGTVSVSGTVGALAPDRTVDLKVTARNAQPLATDLLTANMDLDLTLHGQASTRLDLAGKILIHRADINIPNALPPTVAVLDVRRPGQTAPPPPSARPLVAGLDLAIDAPRAVFVRGRGLEAEVGGELHVGGTTAAPQISGGLDMRRGTFDLAGTSLTFTSGKVTFNGTGLRQKIDPMLDFEAESTSGGITAKLGVNGYADAPRITLTSQPDLPQDEILAHLLFGTSVKQLTALQIAQIGAALVSLTGKGGGGINPLLEARKSLGLDRLSVGSTPTGGTNVEAGRYVSSRVYVGAKQSTSGATQAKVEVDLTKRLKVQAIVGTGGTTAQGITPDNDPGSSIGLTYQFEY